MNTGGEPGRDDYGLPPVDVEIPDDARDLAADVYAYHRELRAQRRRNRTRRLLSPLGKDGLILPVLAACLALTLVTGTVLTVFTSSQGLRPGGTAGITGSGSPSPGSVGGLLPDASVRLSGKQIRLRALARSVLALVPPGCGCGTALRQLRGQAAVGGIPVYLVGTGGAPVAALASQTGTTAGQVLSDSRDVLGMTYHPAGLTAVLVRGNGTVGAIVTAGPSGFHLQHALKALGSASAQGLGSPRAGTATSAGDALARYSAASCAGRPGPRAA